MFTFAVYPRGAQPLRGVTSRQAHRALRNAGLSNKEAKEAIGYCLRNQRALLDRPGVSMHLEDAAPAKTAARMEKEASRGRFIRPPGHEACKVSSCIADATSFGTGELDSNGFWEHGCYECARAWEQQFPEDGECWPFSKETLAKSKLVTTEGAV